MERGNQRKSLPLRVLVFEVPALKIRTGPVCTAEKSHGSSPQIQFSLNLGILYRIFSDAELVKVVSPKNIADINRKIIDIIRKLPL
nr:hypothetical protein [uncultured Oscillibacter sp.]